VPAAVQQELQRMPGPQRLQDGRLLHDLLHAGGRQRQEPQADDGAEPAADETGSETLHREQADDHEHGERHRPPLQRRRHQLQPFHGAQHRDGRRDDAVAVEQRGAEHAQQQQRVAQSGSVPHRARGQRSQRQAAALAVVVGAQHQQHVLQRHHQHQGPEDGRHGADEVHRVHRHAGGGREDLLHGVQRAGADVAVDDAEGAQRQRGQTLAGGRGRRGAGWSGENSGHVGSGNGTGWQTAAVCIRKA